MNVLELLAAAPSMPCRPWPRRLVAPAEWSAIAAEPALSLVAEWADATHAHALFHHVTDQSWWPVSVATRSGRYPGLSATHPAAVWFERAIKDLWGHQADPMADARPWLDHGQWGFRAPLAAHPTPVSPGPPEWPELHPPADGLTQIPVGPVHAGIIEPGHFRLTVDGEEIRRAEIRLGYTHKGTLALMRGKSPRAAARFAARLSGDSTIAHGIAFACAAEAASGTDAPPRAVALRAVMAELERITNHVNDLGAVIGDTGYSVLPARFALHREALREAALAAFGNRIMMDAVVPGGLATDMSPHGDVAILQALRALAAELPTLSQLYVDSDGIADRVVGVGVVSRADADAFAAGGTVARAAGRDVDARLSPGYAPYERLGVQRTLLTAGDVDARLRVRWAEIPESIRLIRALLTEMPEGPVQVNLPMASGEGIGWAESFRGDVWHWLRIEGGLIAASYARDPSWLLWPLLERALPGAIVGDFPLCNRSFAGSYSGVDL